MTFDQTEGSHKHKRDPGENFQMEGLIQWERGSIEGAFACLARFLLLAIRRRFGDDPGLPTELGEITDKTLRPERPHLLLGGVEEVNDQNGFHQFSLLPR